MRFPEVFLLKHIIPKNFIPSYINYIKRTRGRNPDITDVSPEQYRLNLISFFKRCSKANAVLLIVSILKPSNRYLLKSPGVKKNIDLYNSITKDVASKFNNIIIVDPAAEIDNIDSICLDELHINTIGHNIYFEKVFNELRLLYNR